MDVMFGKRNSILLPILILIWVSSGAQLLKNNDTGGKNGRHIGFDSSFLAQGARSSLERFVDNLADSINNISRAGIFPSFLEDSQFDYKNWFGAPSHHPYPIRKMIISKAVDVNRYI